MRMLSGAFAFGMLCACYRVHLLVGCYVRATQVLLLVRCCACAMRVHLLAGCYALWVIQALHLLGGGKGSILICFQSHGRVGQGVLHSVAEAEIPVYGQIYNIPSVSGRQAPCPSFKKNPPNYHLNTLWKQLLKNQTYINPNKNSIRTNQ